MLEPAATEPGRIDYHAEYVARFAKAKVQAEVRGLKYEHPNRANVGWKIHLAVSHDPADPVTRRIAAFIDERRFSFKIGHGGFQEDGKGMTIYVGDRDTTEDLAQELTDAFGDEIPEPRGDVIGGDMQVVGRVWARFENQIDPIRNKACERYLQYGPHGVPALRADGFDFVYGDINAKSGIRSHAIAALTQDYGAFFTGTRSNPV